MNKMLARFFEFGNKVDQQHIQLVLVVLALAMLVLGVGAPSDGGGSISR
jgi:hypothetical protein